MMPVTCLRQPTGFCVSPQCFGGRRRTGADRCNLLGAETGDLRMIPSQRFGANRASSAIIETYGALEEDAQEANPPDTLTQYIQD